jgi:hypothetical protein
MSANAFLKIWINSVGVFGGTVMNLDIVREPPEILKASAKGPKGSPPLTFLKNSLKEGRSDLESRMISPLVFDAPLF